MALTNNDIRYRILCSKPGCFNRLGDWAYKAPANKRLCWNHKKWDIEKEVSSFQSKSASQSSKKTLADAF